MQEQLPRKFASELTWMYSQRVSEEPPASRESYQKGNKGSGGFVLVSAKLAHQESGTSVRDTPQVCPYRL